MAERTLRLIFENTLNSQKEITISVPLERELKELRKAIEKLARCQICIVEGNISEGEDNH